MGRSEAIADTYLSDLANFNIVPGSENWELNSSNTGLPVTASAAGGNVIVGSLIANASADLSTASLRAFASGNSGLFLPGYQGTASATALISDSFTHMTGAAPFTWTSANTAEFNIDVSGLGSLNTGGAPHPPTTYIMGWVSLNVYSKGFFESGLSPFGNAIASFGWGLTPESDMHHDMTNDTFRPVDGFVTNGGGQLTADFAPGADFDWQLQLSVVVAGETGQVPYSGVMDYSHTVTVSYQAPIGADVYSSSGVFPNTAPLAAVPEPETYALMLAGLGLVGFAARRGRG
jgi:hypothetical protein